MTEGSKSLLAAKERFRANLAAWFDREQRPLPWRTERSLYRTVVSELMLQQTQVATMLPYFERWMRALPDFPALAEAGEERVLKLWEGLGYYRRARFLHRLARELVNLAEVPSTAADWAELPGIGPYTAAAIASIHFDQAVACIDGNVVRILARLTCDETGFPDSSKAVRHFQAIAGALLDPRLPGHHNEAMMELGATICVRSSPRCERCPVSAHCLGRQLGLAPNLPRIARPATEKRTVDRAWVLRDGKLLLRRADAGGTRLQGLFELPRVADFALGAKAVDGHGPSAIFKRTITRFQITERIFQVEPPASPLLAESLVWVPVSEIASVALSGPHRRWITELLAMEARCERCSVFEVPPSRPQTA